MFELMIDGIIVTAPDVASVEALCRQGKANGETPIRKTGGGKWSRVKNLKKSPNSQLPLTAMKKDISGDIEHASSNEFIHSCCLKCKKVSKVRSVFEGKMFRCKVCGELVRIQSPAGAAKQATKKESRLQNASEVKFDDDVSFNEEADSWDDTGGDEGLPCEPLPKLPPRAGRMSATNSPPASVPELSDTTIDEAEKQKRFWTKPRILIAVGSTAFVALCLTIAAVIGLIFWAENQTLEEERSFFVGTWLLDHGDARVDILSKLESRDEIKAMNEEQKELVFEAVGAKISESFRNFTLELQRDGVAIMTVPEVLDKNDDGHDSAKVTTGTWEVTGSGWDLKLRLNMPENGIWVPVRIVSEDKFMQIFDSSIHTHSRKM